MRLRPPTRTASQPWSRGSALVLTLFACLAAVVAVQTLLAVVMCAERAVGDEERGRALMAARDEGLATLRSRALQEWSPGAWLGLSEVAGPLDGSLSTLEGGGGWVMRAEVRQPPDVSRIVTSAWVESGRDGLDLPQAVLVAGAACGEAAREDPWIESGDIEESLPGGVAGAEAVPGGGESTDSGGEEAALASARVYLAKVDPGVRLGEGCQLIDVPDPWHLDAGWCLWAGEVAGGGLAAADAADESSGPAAPTVVPGPGVVVVSGRPGATVRPPEDCGGDTADSPVLVVLTGGADLDLRDRGELYGVAVVNDGGVLLDGTALHGALFASETVVFGGAGLLIYAPGVLRWATDGSLKRARLVPGTREEVAQ